MAQKRRTLNIVSVELPPGAKADFDKACADRGMTIKSVLGRLIGWFANQDKTQQAIALGQIDDSDVGSVVDLVSRRSTKKAAPQSKRKGKTTR